MIPIGITARNEAKNIRILLSTLRESVRRAEAALHLRFELHVILNDNEDHTPTLLADEKELTVWQTRGGLVEAQRALVHARPTAPWILFTDADILIHPDTITELAAAMQEHPEVEIAYAEKYPLPPLRRTLLAQALYYFNLREGYQTKRLYCNGQCFAIRRWHIPTVAELRWDPAADNPFLNLATGIRCDDMYLSLGRAPEALRCTPAGIQYRPPETLRGMFRKYQRMRLELERLAHFFPRQNPRRRRLDHSRLRQAPRREQVLYSSFQAALLLCKIAYRTQQFYYGRISKKPCATWLPVTETKEPLG
ncbi:MAG: glycosyltransferase family A protein [Acidobacteria bacterium]|nr:glycosyltransferase family A protein [Acidobacteriota bacterium]